MCVVQSTVFFVFIGHFCVVSPPTTYPHTTHTTTGCATTVSWLLIMTTAVRGCTTTEDWLLIMETVEKQMQ